MYVCLMRHGKAQPFELHQPDKLRELTEKGCNQASSMAKWAASWWPSGKTALWVSPYVRTCQTASYLEKYLPIEQFHTHKAIASGDLVAVYDEILSRETADVVCLAFPRPLGPGLDGDGCRFQAGQHGPVRLRRSRRPHRFGIASFLRSSEGLEILGSFL